MEIDEKRKHTTISSNNLELVDISQLTKKEIDCIHIDTARRLAMKDRAAVRSSHGLSPSLKKRTALVSDKGESSRPKSTTARVKQSWREESAGEDASADGGAEKGVGGGRGRGKRKVNQQFDQESDSDGSGGEGAESRYCTVAQLLSSHFISSYFILYL